jgi:hypothetical protein
MAREAYKLVSKRKDGSLGPLFINRRQRLPIGKWLQAEEHRTNGYAFRPGWHCCLSPPAPHLSEKGRVWVRVQVRDFEEIHRPVVQGGTWLLAKWMRVVGELKNGTCEN